MLNVKKTLTKIMGKLPSIVVDSKTTSAFSISGNNVVETTLNIAKTGYTVLGCVGYTTSGTGVSYLMPYHMYASGSSVSYAFRNMSNSGASNVKVTFYILYIKWGS